VVLVCSLLLPYKRRFTKKPTRLNSLRIPATSISYLLF
jgi:hypothetical protein